MFECTMDGLKGMPPLFASDFRTTPLQRIGRRQAARWLLS